LKFCASALCAQASLKAAVFDARITDAAAFSTLQNLIQATSKAARAERVFDVAIRLYLPHAMHQQGLYHDPDIELMAGNDSADGQRIGVGYMVSP
jgi:hypothetical protein